MSIGLLIVRLVVGLTLAAHGAQKLWAGLAAAGRQERARAWSRLGFRPGRVHATLAGLVEVGAGLFVAAGFLTPASAAAVFAVMSWPRSAHTSATGSSPRTAGSSMPSSWAAVGPGRWPLPVPGTCPLDHALGVSWSGAFVGRRRSRHGTRRRRRSAAGPAGGAETRRRGSHAA